MMRFSGRMEPGSGAASGKFVAKIATVGGQKVFTLTFPVRNGATPAAGDPPGGPLVLEQTNDGVIYSVQSSDEPANWTTLDVSEVTGADAATIQAGLSPVSAGWSYRTFRTSALVAADPHAFMRVEISEGP